MTQALKIVLGIEIALGLVWVLVASMAHGSGGLGAIGVMLIVYAMFAIFFLLAAWACWRHPLERRRAVWIMVLPFAFWVAPVLIRELAGDYLSTEQLVAAVTFVALVLLGTSWFMPKRIAGVIPDGLIRSRIFNWLILLSIIGGWLCFILVVGYVAAADTSSTTGGTTHGIAIMLAAVYLIWLGVGSFVTATWAWICLRSEVANRSFRLSIAQLICATPGVIVGIVVAAWLARQSLA